MFVGESLPWYRPSISTTGPRAQQPRQLTVSSEKFLSQVVSPRLMFKDRSMESKSLGPPRT